jgi:DNA modification methylase
MNDLFNGDCIEKMKSMKANSVDAVVTDPPYGIRFMGKSWDGADIEKMYKLKRRKTPRNNGYKENDGVSFAAGTYDLSPKGMVAFEKFSFLWALEALRVLKPGGHLVSFASCRTYHRMVCGIEMAGFEIRDQLQWLFGSGFPKSHNLKGEFEGWGTALKPGFEPVVLARKPLEKGLSVAANSEKYGTGAINIDGCKIGKERWPSNVLLDEVAAAQLDEQTGILTSGATDGTRTKPKHNNVYGRFGTIEESPREGSSGGASRFFYCAKASTAERSEGLGHLNSKSVGFSNAAHAQGDEYEKGQGIGLNRTTQKQNFHPTVKPIELMEYLIKLVTPKNGIVLDPFMGSGTTGIAAKKLGFNFVGCELAPDYFGIAQARINSPLYVHQPELF